MGNQQERLKLRLAWIAGLIEGEGWISLCKVMVNQKNGKKTQSFTPNIGVCNTDKEIIDEVISCLNDLNIKFRYQKREKSKEKMPKGVISRKDIYEISIATQDAVLDLAQALLPYFKGEKKHRLTYLCDYINLRKSKPRSGLNSKHGEDEFKIYEKMYSYKGKSQFQNPQRLHARSSENQSELRYSLTS